MAIDTYLGILRRRLGCFGTIRAFADDFGALMPDSRRQLRRLQGDRRGVRPRLEDPRMPHGPPSARRHSAGRSRAGAQRRPRRCASLGRDRDRALGHVPRGTHRPRHIHRRLVARRHREVYIVWALHSRGRRFRLPQILRIRGSRHANILHRALHAAISKPPPPRRMVTHEAYTRTIQGHASLRVALPRAPRIASHPTAL